VSAAADKSLRVWAQEEGGRGFACRRALGKRPAEVKAVVDAGGGVALLGDAAGSLYSWDLLDPGSKPAALAACKRGAGVACLAACPRPRPGGGPLLLAVGCADGRVDLIDWSQEVVVQRLEQHGGEVHALRWVAVDTAGAGAGGGGGPGGGGRVESLLASTAADGAVNVYALPARHDAEVSSGGAARLVHTLNLAAPAGAEPGAGRKGRAWLAAAWVPSTALQRDEGRAVEAWLLLGGVGGSTVAWRLSLQAGAAAAAAGEAPVKLSGGGHSRAVFSVHAAATQPSSDPEPGVRFITAGMDRAVMGWRAPLPPARPAATPKEAAAEARAAWQRARSLWSLPGLGGRAYALDACPAPAEGGETAAARLAVGCGDATVRVARLRPGGGGDAPAAAAHQLLWQGVAGKVTAVRWHPSQRELLAFGCEDGSVGVMHCGRECAVVAPVRHKVRRRRHAEALNAAPPSRSSLPPCRRDAWLSCAPIIDALAWSGSLQGSVVHVGWVRTQADAEAAFDEAAATFEPFDGTLQPADCCYLASFSSDGALLRWRAWRDLDALFPAVGRHRGGGPPVRRELGRPQDLPTGADADAAAAAALCAVATDYSSATYALGFDDGGAALHCYSGARAHAVPPPARDPAAGAAAGAPARRAVAHVAVCHSGAALVVAREDSTLEVVLLPDGGDGGGGGGAAHRCAARLAARPTSLATADRHRAHRLGPPFLGDGACDVMVACGLADGRIQLFCWTQPARGAGGGRALEPRRTLQAHSGAVLALTWLDCPGVGQADGVGEVWPVLFSGSEDQSVWAWGAEDLTAEGRSPPPAGPAALGADEPPPPPPPPPPEPPTPASAPPAPAAAAAESAAAESAAATSSGAGVEQQAATSDAGAAGGASVKPPAAALPAKGSKGKELGLAAKGLLPAAGPRAATAEQQAELQAACLQLAAAGLQHGNDDVARHGHIEELLEAFSDPLAASAGLEAASGALGSRAAGAGSAPARRVTAQRAAALALWRGDVGAAAQLLADHDALTADFVSMCAAAGRAAWEAAARLLAAKLEVQGEPHLAALHLLSVGDADAALGVYSRCAMLREAVALASARLLPGDAALATLRGEYAAQLSARGEHERAAAQHLAARRWADAVKALAAREGGAAAQAALALGDRLLAAPAARERGGVDEAARLDLLVQQLRGRVESGGEEAAVVEAECAEARAVQPPSGGGGGRRRYVPDALLALRAAAPARPPELPAGLELAP
jgi:hypothetical protein